MPKKQRSGHASQSSREPRDLSCCGRARGSPPEICTEILTEIRISPPDLPSNACPNPLEAQAQLDVRRVGEEIDRDGTAENKGRRAPTAPAKYLGVGRERAALDHVVMAQRVAMRVAAHEHDPVDGTLCPERLAHGRARPVRGGSGAAVIVASCRAPP
jgi:hypothetical protein